MHVIVLAAQPLPAGVREGFVAQWKMLRSRFTQDERRTVLDADRLVQRVLSARGYPMDAVVAANGRPVDYGPLIADYRRAHAIADAAREGRASPHDLYEAFALHRSLFDVLLDPGSGEAASESIFERPHF